MTSCMFSSTFHRIPLPATPSFGQQGGRPKYFNSSQSSAQPAPMSSEGCYLGHGPQLPSTDKRRRVSVVDQTQPVQETPIPMMLAGEPLPKPRNHPVPWIDGDRWAPGDDPDRMDIPWIAPAFVRQKPPSSQQTTGCRVHLPRGAADRIAMPIKSFARVVRGVLEPSECVALIEGANAKGFTPALTSIGDGYQVYDARYRSSGRCIIDSPELATYLFGILEQHLPKGFYQGTRAEIRLSGLNERFRFLCYKPGDSFQPHCDGCYYRPKNHPDAGSKSVVTVQLYLHDIPEAYGGATTFIGKDSKVSCQPLCGSALLFTQDLYHEGSLLKHGYKYAIRTEAMYCPAHKKQAEP